MRYMHDEFIGITKLDEAIENLKRLTKDQSDDEVVWQWLAWLIELKEYRNMGG